MQEMWIAQSPVIPVLKKGAAADFTDRRSMNLTILDNILGFGEFVKERGMLQELAWIWQEQFMSDLSF